MKTFKVTIKKSKTETHHYGSIAVVANSEIAALNMCAEELDTTINDFETPVEVKSGIVCRATRSAWEGYH